MSEIQRAKLSDIDERLVEEAQTKGDLLLVNDRERLSSSTKCEMSYVQRLVAVIISRL